MSAIDVDEGVKRVVNNKKLYHRLLGTFSGRKLAGDITKAIQDGDPEAAARACHALKGTAANLAMHPLANVTGRIEECLRASQDPTELVAELNDRLEEVEQAVAEILAAE